MTKISVVALPFYQGPIFGFSSIQYKLSKVGALAKLGYETVAGVNRESRIGLVIKPSILLRIVS